MRGVNHSYREWNLIPSYCSWEIFPGCGIARTGYNNRSEERISHFIISNEAFSYRILDKTLTDNKRENHGLCRRAFSLPSSSCTTGTKGVLRRGRRKNKENSFHKLWTGSRQLLGHIWLNRSKYYSTFRADQKKELGQFWGILLVIAIIYYVSCILDI